MIEHIYTLREELQGKRIFVWDCGRKAMWLFSTLALRGIHVAGFVTNFPEFVGQTIMGRPIISLETFAATKDALAIVDDDVRTGAFNVVASRGQALYMQDALELNPSLRKLHPYIYELDDQAWHLAKALGDEGVTVSGLLVKNQKKSRNVLGLPVLALAEARLSRNDAIIIPMQSDHPLDGAITSILDSGFDGYIFIHEVMCHFELWGHSLVFALNQAMLQKRRILLCCADAPSRELLHRVLDGYGIGIHREVNPFPSPGQDASAEDIWTLADEDPERSTLVLGAFSGKKRLELVDAAVDLGFSAADLSLAGLQKTVYNQYFQRDLLAYEHDAKLVVSIDYSSVGGIPGWMIHGDEGSASTRIMILGGSTSTELYYPESWVEKLYSLFVNDGIDVVIFNGANEGNGAPSELVRMARDIHAIRPDFVISMSGMNDQRSLDSKFEKNHHDNPFEYWLRMERYMKHIAESEGAVFLGVLQPMNACMEPKSLLENAYFMSENHKIGRTFLSGMRDDDFYCNLLALFHHEQGMFIDRCHYSDEANQRIAEEVYRLLKERM